MPDLSFVGRFNDNWNLSVNSSHKCHISNPRRETKLRLMGLEQPGTYVNSVFSRCPFWTAKLCRSSSPRPWYPKGISNRLINVSRLVHACELNVWAKRKSWVEFHTPKKCGKQGSGRTIEWVVIYILNCEDCKPSSSFNHLYRHVQKYFKCNEEIVLN